MRGSLRASSDAKNTLYISQMIPLNLESAATSENAQNGWSGECNASLDQVCLLGLGCHLGKLDNPTGSEILLWVSG